MASLSFVGYPGTIWLTCWTAMNWLSELLNGGATPPEQTAAGAVAVYATLVNGATAVSAYEAAALLANEATGMNAIENMVLPLDPLTSAYFTARVASTTAAASGLAALVPAVNPFGTTGMLTAGQPAIPDAGGIEWSMGFLAETPPDALAVSGVVACAQQEQTAWLNVAQAIVNQVGGLGNTDYRYDVAARTARTAGRIALLTSQFQSGPLSIATAGVWNTMVALPSIMLSAGVLASAPSTIGVQQANVVRYALDSISSQLAQYLLALRAPGGSTPGLATLNVGESLQSLAARTSGNFETWTDIVALNSLTPPYPSRANQALSLTSGSTLLIPGISGVVTPGTPVASYAINVLGADWDFGPINGNPPPWNGDIPLITGYKNLSRALGRRLQTPLGALIYHTTYGSRIPAEVGAIQSVNEAPKMAQFGKSALIQDPRTGSVLTATATTQPGFLCSFSGVVQPIGPGSSPVSANETISPLP